jgi:hypothetical protein
MWLPGYVFLPRGEIKSVIVPLEPRGRTAQWREGDLYPKLAAAGHAVAAFDIRGIGDLWPEVGRGNPFHTRPHAEEDPYAWASLILGKPLLGQRVSDILAIVQALRNEESMKGARIKVAALSHLTVPALLAAVMNQSISSIYTARALPSYESLLETEDYTEPFANFIPGAIGKLDLPALRTSLASRLVQGTAWDFDALNSL